MQPTVILKRPVHGLTSASVSRFIVAAARLAKLRGAVTVLLTSSKEVRALNLRFKGKDYATDVLSFPAPVFAHGFAGDIVISADIARKNARGLRNSPTDEVKILALHGILHLAGYDHESDSGEMAEKEMRFRKRLGLPASLIERESGPANKPRKTPKPPRVRT